MKKIRSCRGVETTLSRGRIFTIFDVSLKNIAMDKQDLAYLEARISLLEALVYNNESDLQFVISTLETSMQKINYQNAELLKSYLQDLLKELQHRLDSFSEE